MTALLDFFVVFKLFTEFLMKLLFFAQYKHKQVGLLMEVDY